MVLMVPKSLILVELDLLLKHGYAPSSAERKERML